MNWMLTSYILGVGLIFFAMAEVLIKYRLLKTSEKYARIALDQSRAIVVLVDLLTDSVVESDRLRFFPTEDTNRIAVRVLPKNGIGGGDILCLEDSKFVNACRLWQEDLHRHEKRVEDILSQIVKEPDL